MVETVLEGPLVLTAYGMAAIGEVPLVVKRVMVLVECYQSVVFTSHQLSIGQSSRL